MNISTALRNRNASRRAFSIIELMIAMAATLLIMGAITRAYGLIGNSIRDSRVQVQMSSQTRDLMFGLRTELASLTASNDPNDPDGGVGYLMMQEGPMTDSTTATFYGTGLIDPKPGYFPLSRWGDTDDYVAFTAQAPKNAPFTGVVPWGVLEASRVVSLTAAGIVYSRPAGFNPTQPVVITSQYAEVCYWMGPRMARDTAGNLIYEADDGDNADGMIETGSPQYLDIDNDDYPDEFVLYRRALLIRPDLNVTSSQLTTAASVHSTNSGASITNLVGSTPLQDNQPCIGFLRNTSGAIEIEPAGTSTAYAALSPGAWRSAQELPAPNWLVGMGRVQQSMDLSVALEFRKDTSNGLSYGYPINFASTGAHPYSANSLESLRSPHRRFAHVMMPDNSTNTAFPRLMPTDQASMPLLALSPPLKFLAKGPTPPVTTPTTNVTDDGVGSTPNLCDRFTLVGHLRPEFALGGAREGEDIIAANVVGFDAKVFDPGAPVFVSAGPDGAPGQAGVNDDGNRDNAGADIIDDATEFGAIYSDDNTVTPNEPFIYVAARSGNGIAFDSSVAWPISRGTFVDLGYALQAGGNLRFAIDDGPNPNLGLIKAQFYDFLKTPFSGIELPVTGSRVPKGFGLSGKFVTRNNNFSFLQPTFDSWTNEYNSDSIDHHRQGLRPNAFNTSACQTTNWIYTDPTASVVPRTNDVTENGGNQSEVLPPVGVPLEAMKIIVRVYDAGTRQVDQLEVVKDFK
ncbi:MAG: hypothetical protein WBD31_08805 [Rubripirellula sp.]